MADEEFGDSEPEDAWHPEDPLPVLLDNLRRRIALLRVSLVAVATAREQLRLRDLEGDLDFIRARVLAELDVDG